MNDPVTVLEAIKDAELPVDVSERRTLFVAQIRNGGRARIVYASPELQHHASLIEMKQKQDLHKGDGNE